MTNIVLYRVVWVAGLLMAINTLAGQKQTIGLLPSSHRYMHPEARLDINSANDTLVYVIPSTQHHNMDSCITKTGSGKKLHSQSGLNPDSDFQKEETRKSRVVTKSGLFPPFLNHFNPIKLFIQITALN